MKMDQNMFVFVDTPFDPLKGGRAPHPQKRWFFDVILERHVVRQMKALGKLITNHSSFCAQAPF